MRKRLEWAPARNLWRYGLTQAGVWVRDYRVSGLVQLIIPPDLRENPRRPVN
jgi:hypothetical protein